MLIELNTIRAPLNDKRVRQAIAYAIDRKFILRTSGTALAGSRPDLVGHWGRPTPRKACDGTTSRIASTSPTGCLTRWAISAAPTARFKMVHDVGPSARTGGGWANTSSNLLAWNRCCDPQQRLAYHMRQVFTDHDFFMASGWFIGMADPTLGVQRQYWSKNIKPERRSTPPVTAIPMSTGCGGGPDRTRSGATRQDLP